MMQMMMPIMMMIMIINCMMLMMMMIVFDPSEITSYVQQCNYPHCFRHAIAIRGSRYRALTATAVPTQHCELGSDLDLRRSPCDVG